MTKTRQSHEVLCRRIHDVFIPRLGEGGRNRLLWRMGRRLAFQIMTLCPDQEERDQGVTKLEEALVLVEKSLEKKDEGVLP